MQYYTNVCEYVYIRAWIGIHADTDIDTHVYGFWHRHMCVFVWAEALVALYGVYAHDIDADGLHRKHKPLELP